MTETKPTILILDDNRGFLLDCELLFKTDLEVVVELFETISASIRFLEKNHVDIIISDYSLNDGNGLYLAEYVRAVMELNTPIILISSYCRHWDPADPDFTERTSQFRLKFFQGSLKQLLEEDIYCLDKPFTEEVFENLKALVLRILRKAQN